MDHLIHKGLNFHLEFRATQLKNHFYVVLRMVFFQTSFCPNIRYPQIYDQSLAPVLDLLFLIADYEPSRPIEIILTKSWNELNHSMHKF